MNIKNKIKMTKFFAKLGLSKRNIIYNPTEEGFQNYISTILPQWKIKVNQTEENLSATITKGLKKDEKINITLKDQGNNDFARDLYLNMIINFSKKLNEPKKVYQEICNLNKILNKYSNELFLRYSEKTSCPLIDFFENNTKEFIYKNIDNPDTFCVEAQLNNKSKLISTVNSLVDVMNEYYTLQKQ